MPLNCLQNAVGITESDCACITQGLTSDEIASLRVSTSGLYLDNLPGGVHLKALNHVDQCRKMKAMAETAISNATKTTEDDLLVAINNKYTKSKNNFFGAIGRMSFASTLAAAHRFRGLRIRPTDYSNGVITLNKITALMNETASFPLMLYKVPYKSVMGELIETWTVNALANQYVNVAPVLPATYLKKLPLVENGELVEYWFVYDLQGETFRPKDTKVDCSTCDRSGSAARLSFIESAGVSFSDINNLQYALTDPYSSGLVLDVSIKCDTEKLFCDEYNAQEAVAVVMAYCVYYKAGELLIEDVMKQPDVNRYTTMGKEYLWGKRNHFRTQYEQRITYLASVIDVGASNCYVCRETANQPFVSGIFS